MAVKGRLMDRKCINCRHFRQGSVGPTKPEYVWGDCAKGKNEAQRTEDSALDVSFVWADGCCGHFEPKDQQDKVSLGADSAKT